MPRAFLHLRSRIVNNDTTEADEALDALTFPQGPGATTQAWELAQARLMSQHLVAAAASRVR